MVNVYNTFGSKWIDVWYSSESVFKRDHPELSYHTHTIELIAFWIGIDDRKWEKCIYCGCYAKFHLYGCISYSQPDLVIIRFKCVFEKELLKTFLPQLNQRLSIPSLSKCICTADRKVVAVHTLKNRTLKTRSLPVVEIPLTIECCDNSLLQSSEWSFTSFRIEVTKFETNQINFIRELISFTNIFLSNLWDIATSSIDLRKGWMQERYILHTYFDLK